MKTKYSKFLKFIFDWKTKIVKIFFNYYKIVNYLNLYSKSRRKNIGTVVI